MNYIEEDQVSMTEDNYEILAADSDSTSPPPPTHFGDGTIRVDEENWEHTVIKNCFRMGMGRFCTDTQVVAVHKNSHSMLSGQAKLRSFQIFSEAVSKKNGGNPNIKFAWYGGSKEEISNIILHGFAHSKPYVKYGRGVYLSPAKFSMDSVSSSDVDENGLRHILLCRVILGNTEEICADSEQFQPSSEEFDTGVDNFAEPKKYIVWNCYMNSHILPSFIVSFKSPSLIGLARKHVEPALIPKSPYMSFPKLMSVLETYLVPREMVLITKYHTAFRAHKITRKQLISKVREIAGDNLLKAVIRLSRIKTCRNFTISGAA